MGGPKDAVSLSRPAVLVVLAVIALFSVSSWAQPVPPSQELALQLRDNVVSLVATWPEGTTHDGFGFIVGERAREVFIVTANHVVRGAGPGEVARSVTVKYFGALGTPSPAKLLETSDAAHDLAVLQAKLPEGLSWRRDTLNSAEVLRHDAQVWFIGRAGKWYVPAVAGTFNATVSSEDSLAIDNLNVLPGTSGAPLIGAGASSG